MQCHKGCVLQSDLAGGLGSGLGPGKAQAFVLSSVGFREPVVRVCRLMGCSVGCSGRFWSCVEAGSVVGLWWMQFCGELPPWTCGLG